MEGRNVKDISLNLVTNDGSFSKIAFSALTKGNTWFWFAKKALLPGLIQSIFIKTAL